MKTMMKIMSGLTSTATMIGMAVAIAGLAGCASSTESKQFGKVLEQLARNQDGLMAAYQAGQRPAAEEFGNPSGRAVYNRTVVDFNDDPNLRAVKKMESTTSASAITDSKYASAEMYWNQEEGIGSQLGEKLPVGGYFKVTGADSSSSGPIAALGAIYDLRGRTATELGGKLFEGNYALVDKAGGTLTTIAELRKEARVSIVTAAGEFLTGALQYVTPLGRAAAGLAPLIQATIRQDDGTEANGTLTAPEK